MKLSTIFYEIGIIGLIVCVTGIVIAFDNNFGFAIILFGALSAGLCCIIGCHLENKGK